MSDAVFSVLSEHGPWVILVFYLLYRDVEKDRATRLLLDKNTAILVELSTIIRERLPAMGG
ncbi:MAG: hypothetical protein AAFY77_10160 [Pseudomonadota bacterium]